MRTVVGVRARPGDRMDVQPRAAVVDHASGRRRGVALGAPFDLRPLLAPGPVDGSVLGITQDVVRVPGRFAAVHTESDPQAVTRVVLSRVRAPRAADGAPKLARQ